MYAKLQITGDIEVKTGMHIGGSSAFAAIGAIDSPVIRDARTNLPMIPGSSFKGKMRSLLAKEFNTKIVQPDDDDEKLTHLFGCAKKDKVSASRIIVSDMFLTNAKELSKKGIKSATENKFENSINRATAVANPRQIERVVRGAVFGLDMIYEVRNDMTEEDIISDIQLIAEGLKLISYDYLGGSGSRGYGKVNFKNLSIDSVVGDVDNTVLDKCAEILNKIEGINER